MKQKNLAMLLGLGVAGKIAKMKFDSRHYLKGKVVLITGGSKGLGEILAEHLAREE